IIAILAAIAIPNLLEAQVRARVSRVKAEMNTVTLAIESYRVDNNKYPIYLNSHDAGYPNYPRDTPGSLNDRAYEFCVPITLTTPSAYISSIPDDPFRNLHTSKATEMQPHPYHYSNDEDFSSNDTNSQPGAEQSPVRFLYTLEQTQ